MKIKRDRLFNLLMLGVCLMSFVAQAAPVAVTNIITSPGFVSGVVESNRQDLAYIEVGSSWYAPVGATCTECSAGIISYAIREPIPTLLTNMLSGLKYTQAVLNLRPGQNLILGL